MSWSRSVSFWLSCGLCALGCRQEPDLQLLGESTRLSRAEPSPAKSAIFDGKQLGLRGARGETLGVQLRMPTRGERREQRVRLELPAEAAAVQSFAVRSLNVVQPSTIMYGVSRGPGQYPD